MSQQIFPPCIEGLQAEQWSDPMEGREVVGWYDDDEELLLSLLADPAWGSSIGEHTPL